MSLLELGISLDGLAKNCRGRDSGWEGLGQLGNWLELWEGFECVGIDMNGI